LRPIFICAIVQVDAGWSSPVARQAHNLKVTGSNPVPATSFIQRFVAFPFSNWLSLHGKGMQLKRLIEFILALILVVPVAIVSLILMLIIRIETPGFPMVFQKRVGKNERIFTCFKLRTFVVGSEVVAIHEAAANQITRVGQIIRPLHFDELPQIFNVLTGAMSFVGYRPCLPFMNDVIEARRALGVYKIRPGITGIAQVEGVDMRYPVELARLDALYVPHRSWLLDLRLCASTLLPSLWQRWRLQYVTNDNLN
jgi:O-antigen biosynthesis protein WbqP